MSAVVAPVLSQTHPITNSPTGAVSAGSSVFSASASPCDPEAVWVFDGNLRGLWANSVAEVCMGQVWTAFSGRTLTEMSQAAVSASATVFSPSFVESVRRAQTNGQTVFWRETWHLTEQYGATLTQPFGFSSGEMEARAVPVPGGGVAVYLRPHTPITQMPAEAVASPEPCRRTLLRNILLGLSGSRLCLCRDEADLPQALPALGPPVRLGNGGIRQFRKQARQQAASWNYGDERSEDIESAVGEAAMNAVVHAHGGEGVLCGDKDTKALQTWVRDWGTGIPDHEIHRATLERGYSTAGSFGHGFWVMLQTTHRVHLHTGPHGTVLVLEHDQAPLSGLPV